MKLHELASPQDLKNIAATSAENSDITGKTDIPDPVVLAKKRQLETMNRQLENARKQLEQQTKLGRQNPVLEKKILDLKEKMNKIKATMLDDLEVTDKK